MDKEVDTNKRNSAGLTPLQLLFKHQGYHTFHNFLLCLQALLGRNCTDANKILIPSGFTPLSFFCYFYNGFNILDIIKLLLQHGADVNQVSKRGWNEGYNCLLYLCNRPIDREIEHKFLEIFKTLTDAGVDVNAKDCNSETALVKLCSKRCNHPEFFAMARYLILKGADVNGKNSIGCTPLLNFCIYNSYPYLIEIVRMFVRAGADIFVKDHKGLDASFYLKRRKVMRPWDIDLLLSVKL